MPTPARLALVLATVTAVAFGRLAAAEPNVGDTLNSNTASSAANLLPPEILKHYQDDGYVNPIVEWPASKFNWPTDFHAATKTNEGKFTVTPEGGIVEAGSKEAAAVHPRLSIPHHPGERPAGRGEGGVELLLPHLVLRQPRGRVAGELGGCQGPRAAQRPERALHVLRRRPREGAPQGERRELPEPAARGDPGARRSQRHGRPHLSLPRPGQARLVVGLRPGAASRAGGEPGKSLRRFPRLRHEPGRRPVLRRQAGGLRAGSWSEGRTSSASSTPAT